MGGMRLAAGIGAIVLTLTGTLIVVIGLFTLSTGAWFGTAVLGVFAGSLYVLAYLLYRMWRRLANTPDDEHRRPSAE